MSRRPDPLRVAFIGAGGIAERHVGVLAQMEDVAVVAVADPDFQRAESLGSRLQARPFRHYDDLLDFARPEAVFICVPPFAHGTPEVAVMEAGLPFFVEKPLSLDLETAEMVAARIDRQALVTAVGYQWRYLDTVEEAKGLLADNPPQLVSGYWLDQTPPPQWWWRNDRSGGQMVEQATHIVDLARYLVGDVREVYARCAPARPRADFPGLDVATAHAATLWFANGAVGNIASTCMLRWGHRVGLHVFSDGLAIELSEREIMVDVGQGRPVRQAGDDPVLRQDRDFIDAVRGVGNRIRCPYRAALESHRVSLAIAESARTGLPVSIAARVAEPLDA